MMAKAEAMKYKFVGGTHPIWASMGILINKKKVDQKVCDQILSRWAKEFKTDGGGNDSSEYRVGKEKLSISKKGELQIQWPNSVDKGEQSKMEEIDFLIATSTKPKYQQQGDTKYPSSNEIAASVKNDLSRRYFINNFQNRITTFQDNSIINLL